MFKTMALSCLFSGIRYKIKYTCRHATVVDFKFCRTTTSSCNEIEIRLSDVLKLFEEKCTAEPTLKQFYDARNFTSLAKFLVSRNVDSDGVIESIRKQPELLSSFNTPITDGLNLLINFGFSTNQALNVFIAMPRLLNFHMSEISNKLQTLRSLKLEESALNSLVTKIPELLFSDVNEVRNKFEILKKFFRKDDLHILIEKSPTVFVEDWFDVEQKIDYVIFKMGLDQRHIVRTGALKYSLQFIALRHQFLERAGMYKFPSKKNFERYKNNPNLEDIINSSDSEFVRKHTHGLSFEEYEMFKQMINFEMELDQNTDSDSEEEI